MELFLTTDTIYQQVSYLKGAKNGVFKEYYKNGKIWTNIWSEMSAKGNYSGNEMSFRFHISYLWDGDKIIEEVQFFNPTAFNAEGLAKEMSLNK